MNVMLDGQAIFDEQGLMIAVGSPCRACVERGVCGLDGTLSIDLGARGRRIRQTGVLRAASRAAMNARVGTVAAFIDGATHALTAADGRIYNNLRMDSFTQISERTSGPGLLVEYEIVYTQLGD
jgi:hypothetical protein